MLKTNKKIIILTSIITLIPLFLGLALWNKLPDTIATHFDLSGTADGWSSKPFAVFFLPLFLLAVHLICTIATSADPRRQNISDKLFALVLWICPVISVLMCCSVYLIALGFDLNMSLIAQLLVGVVFIIIGNYLPKCRQNYTMGIKLPWTLADEDNWNKTHRLAGWLWMVAGLLFLVFTLMDRMSEWFLLGVILVAVLVPTAYSFLLHLKKEKID
ncbi:MAG: SdpI family protein [Oscillospiraceae bacterium]|nr:SdpI family protein [Oscillospiraceae bacterium]